MYHCQNPPPFPGIGPFDYHIIILYLNFIFFQIHYEVLKDDFSRCLRLIVNSVRTTNRSSSLRRPASRRHRTLLRQEELTQP